MSETCIVCLGDLESANALPRPANPAIKSDDDEHGGPVPGTHRSSTRSDDLVSEMIAHLLPCGHNLHDECLKPWVERANSCPICRQNFNKVELNTKVGGKCLLSRAQSYKTMLTSCTLRAHRFHLLRQRPNSDCGSRSDYAYRRVRRRVRRPALSHLW